MAAAQYIHLCRRFLAHPAILSLRKINQLVFVMEKCCAIFEVGTKFFKHYLDRLHA